MGIWDKISAGRDRSRFEALVNAGLYEDAVVIAERGNVEPDRVAVAREKLAIADAIRNCAAGNLAAEVQGKIDTLFERALEGTGTFSTSQSLALRARVRTLLRNNQIDQAVDLAAHIPDREVQAQAFRCIAGAVAPEHPADAITMIAAMPNMRYRQEELRNLCFSRLILRDFKTAHDIAAGLPEKAESELSYRLRQAAHINLVKLIFNDPPKAEWHEVVGFIEKYHTRPDEATEVAEHPSDEFQLPMALLYCVIGRIEAAAERLNRFPLLSMEHGRMQRGLFGTVAMSLAYAGRGDQARQFLAGYSGPLLFEAEAHLMGHFAFPMHAYREFAARVDQGKIPEHSLGDCGSTLGLLALELVAMNEPNEASAMVAALSDKEIRRVTVGQTVDFVHEVLHAPVV